MSPRVLVEGPFIFWFHSYDALHENRASVHVGHVGHVGHESGWTDAGRGGTISFEATTMSPMTAILKTEIVRGLEFLGEGGLDEVRAHVAALVEASGRRGPTRTSLAGIWKDRGFERVSDLEGEIREVREELGDAIARRRL